MHEAKSPEKPNPSHGIVIFIAIVIVGWLLLKAYAQSGVNDYNDCFKRAVNNTESAKNATIAAGYNPVDAEKAAFDNYADQLNYCNKQRPPDWVILITGVQAKD